MTFVGSVDVSSARAGVLARLAGIFVRNQLDVVSSLVRLLRNGSRVSAMPEEEQW
jgi:hypothetical protein